MSKLNLSYIAPENTSLLIEEESTSEDIGAINVHAVSLEDDERSERHRPNTCLTSEERRSQRLNSDLLTSIENGDVEQFRKCLRKGASVNATCRRSKFTACHSAVFFNQCALLEDLLKSGANLLPLASSGCYPVHIAAWKGCERCLQTLYSHKPDSISIPTTVKSDDSSDDEFSSTILDSWDHYHELQSIEVPFIAEGSTALHIACRQLHIDCIQFLLNNNADIEAQDSYGRVALDMIVKTIETIYELKQNNTKRSLKTVYSSLENVEEFDPNVTSIEDLNFDELTESVIFFLIKYASSTIHDCTSCDLRSTYMLHPAVIMQNKKLLKFLLGRNVDVEVCMASGDTPLHLAVRCKMRTAFDVLVKDEKIRNILEVKEKEGKTALLLAVEGMWNYAANVLLEAGANTIAITDRGDNILHFAAKTNNAAIMREIFTIPKTKRILNYRNILNETPLVVAVVHSHLRCVEELLIAGADSHMCSENSNTIAHIAAKMGYTEILNLILRRNPNLKNEKTNSNETPLHLAVMCGHVDCVKLLLSKGSSVKTETLQNFNGSPLHHAVMDGRLDIVRCLIERDQKLVYVVNDAGWCPLQTAIQFNQPRCAEYILKHGGNLSNRFYLNGSVVSVCDTLCTTFNQPVAFLERIWDSCIEINNKAVLRFNVLRPSVNKVEDFEVLHTLIRSPIPELSNRILLHPLTQTFVDFKWRKLGKYSLIVSLILHLILANCLLLLGRTVNDPVLVVSGRKSTLITVTIILACLLPLCMKEVYVVARKPRRPFEYRPTRIRMKWITYFTSMVVGLYGAYSYDQLKNTIWWKPSLTISIILLWAEISRLLLLVPKCSMQTLLVRRAFLTVIKVTISIIFCAFGVILMYRLVFRTSIYPDKWEMYECGNKEDCQSLNTLVNTFIVTVLVVGWLLIITIFVVHDIRYVQSQGKLEILIEKVEYLRTLQIFLYDDQFLKLVPRKIDMFIRKRRSVCDPLVISCEKFRKYKKSWNIDRNEQYYDTGTGSENL